MPSEQIDDGWMDGWMDGWIYGSMGTYNTFNFCYDIKSSTNIGVRVHEYESDDDEHTGQQQNTTDFKKEK